MATVVGLPTTVACKGHSTTTEALVVASMCVSHESEVATVAIRSKSQSHKSEENVTSTQLDNPTRYGPRTRPFILSLKDLVGDGVGLLRPTYGTSFWRVRNTFFV